MKVYSSKDDLYKDYQIAVKFVLEPPKTYYHSRDYEKIVANLKAEHGCKFEEFNRSVKNFQQEYPLSAGFVVEVPVSGDTGQPLGSRYVVLMDETGWEWWIGTIVGGCVKKGVDIFCDFCKRNWQKLHAKQARIDHVEIRTAEKGIGRLAFSEFDPKQLECLLGKVQQIASIHEANQECFGGLLLPVTERVD